VSSLRGRGDAFGRELDGMVTLPSLRPREAAKPELVVARALKPSDASNLAEPRSHGFGSRSGSPARCRARNSRALSA